MVILQVKIVFSFTLLFLKWTPYDCLDWLAAKIRTSGQLTNVPNIVCVETTQSLRSSRLSLAAGILLDGPAAAGPLPGLLETYG
jgi:hypothetical protein